MTIAVFGTGDVGQRIGDKLHTLGHEVVLGSRSADNEKGGAWAARRGNRARVATFRDAAGDATELIFLCTSGAGTVAAVESAGDALDGKILVDLTNPLDFSQGFPPRLSVCNDDSLGEQVQAAAPNARVVKTLNTLANVLMVEPKRLPEESDIFVCGEDDAAKEKVCQLLRDGFGHTRITDLGGIRGARAVEAWLLLWTTLYGTLGTSEFNLRLVRANGD